MMGTSPAHLVADDPPFVERIADKVRTLAAVKPALVRRLEWQIDAELERTKKPPGKAASMTAPAFSFAGRPGGFDCDQDHGR